MATHTVHFCEAPVRTVRDPEAGGAVPGHGHKGPRRVEAAHQAPHVQLVALERAAQSVPGGAAALHGPGRSAARGRPGRAASGIRGPGRRGGRRAAEAEGRAGQKQSSVTGRARAPVRKGGREGARRAGRVTQQP